MQNTGFTMNQNCAMMGADSLQQLIKNTVQQTLFGILGGKNLENFTAGISDMSERTDDMSKRIKREINIDGEKKWVTAANEQEYAEKCAHAFAQGRIQENTKPQSESKHNFTEYDYKWFETFSKPNVEKVTSITYERQLKLHICPVLGEKNVEDITPLDVQAMFNRMGNASKETKNKAKIVLNMIISLNVSSR